jgi:hypothetical protein
MAAKYFKVSRVQGALVQDGEILDDLRLVAGKTGSPRVSQSKYKSHGSFDESTVARRFGSWNKALLAAGLELSNEVGLSDDRLFENILILWQYYGRQPRRAELSKPPSTISQSPYHRRFKSWMDALKAFVEFANASEASPDGTMEDNPVVGKPATGRDPSLRLRFRVLQRDRFCCRSCGANPANDLGVHLHVDHIVPWSAGGETVFDNLQTLCSDCNLGKGNMHRSG